MSTPQDTHNIDEAPPSTKQQKTSTSNKLSRSMNPMRIFADTKSSSNNKQPNYPQHIIVGQVDPKIERQIERRKEKDEIEYWKVEAEKCKAEVEKWQEKTRSLREAIDFLEAKVTSLEHSSTIGGGGDICNVAGGNYALSSSDRVDTSYRSAYDVCNPQSSSPPPSPSSPRPIKTSKKVAQMQRRDEMVLELVAEMERVITLRTKAMAGDETTDDINTHILENIITRALDDKKSPSSSSRSKGRKGSKSSSFRDMYQLSCKHCIGQNFVGSTKNELKCRVKDHYGVIWQVVKTAYGKSGDDGSDSDKGSSGSGKEEEGDPSDLHEQSLAFRASSFSHHVASHCQDCETEAEVYKWCVKNVKVEKIGKHII